MKQLFAFLLTASIIVVGGCNRTPKAAVIAEWEQFQDPFFRCTFMYPKQWQVSSDGTKISIYSLPDGAQKFFDPTSRGEGGSELVISYEKAPGQSLDSLVESFKSEMAAAGYVILSSTGVVVDGENAFQVIYTGKFADDTRTTSSRTLILKDTTLYYLHYAGFNDYYAANRSALDTLLATIRLPRPKVVDPKVDPALPSSDFLQFSNNVLEVSYPSNFESSFPMPKGEIKFSIELKGYRQDCSVRIDEFPAKGNPLDKVFEQNQKFYKAKSNGATTIDALPAKYLDYSPAKGIESRVYFVVKNDNVFRIITNYYQGLKKEFVPAFQKTVSSIKIK